MKVYYYAFNVMLSYLGIPGYIRDYRNLTAVSYSYNRQNMNISTSSFETSKGLDESLPSQYSSFGTKNLC